ncbi:MAG: hypothetical protein IID41_03380 [Planctomycetes bacterium]|nr:hypothetical protein [Planctomycetota bacterium]
MNLIVQQLTEINQKMNHLMEQLRKDLYVLVPRDDDRVFGGPVRSRRAR